MTLNVLIPFLLQVYAHRVWVFDGEARQLGGGTYLCKLGLSLPGSHSIGRVRSDIAEDRARAFVAAKNVVALGESNRLSIDQRVPWPDASILAHDDGKSLPSVICFADSE